MLYLICSQLTSMEHYMLDAIVIPHVCLQIPPMRECKTRRMSHLFWRLGLNIKYNLFGKDFCNLLSKIESTDIVVFFMVENKEPVLNMCSWINKKTRKMVWFWNSINDGLNAAMHSMAEDIKWMKKVGCEIATFDPFDASALDIKKCCQFFNFSGAPKLDHEPQYDLYFIGNPRGKSREKILEEIMRTANSQNLSFNVLMRNKTMNGYVSYQENLLFAANSHCIVEIVRENQTGLSLRPLEAVAMKKKLITNNAFIKDYDFYCPENVFIWGEDNPERLSNFVSSPFKPLSEHILQEYDVNTWINNLLYS